MTNEEYLTIVENPNKLLTLEELFFILHRIKIDVEEEIEWNSQTLTIEHMRWCCGMINGLDVAINLLEHLELN